MIKRRYLVLSAAAAALPRAVSAQPSFPTRPIRIIVPFSAGGSPDLVARLLAPELGKKLGQTVIVENRTGANGMIAGGVVFHAPPDGYTLLLDTGSHVINPSLYKKMPFDTFEDFEAVSVLGIAPCLTLVVNPKTGAKDIQEFLALARQPNKITYGSPGIGNTLHLIGELINKQAGTHMQHVPYKGAAPALAAVMSGEISACFLSATAAIIAVHNGQVRPLAVTSAKRVPFFPSVPSFAESGVPGIDYNGGWNAIFASARTPKPIVDKLSAEIAQSLETPAIREQLIAWGTPPVGGTPEAANRFMLAEFHKFAEIIKSANVTVETS
ncbi:MAG: tripartite tricarboxylate transporter substrate binding protein [Pseudomonadota bacterium]|nr:tripartite tricarboxylate transporter substrate binding protein [Pseudomonadota bacterium]